MKSKRLMIDEFVKDLEKFIDLRYAINRETDLCNHSYVVTNLNPQYREAKLKLEDSITILLTENT